MDSSVIIYAIVALQFFLIIAAYDIHMFQLSSYRYSRYFRWLVPGNIVSLKRVMALGMLLAIFIPENIAAIAITLFAFIRSTKEKFKTPLVYTKRVNRLFVTNTILFIAIEAIAILFAGKWANAAIGGTLLLSNTLMLIANIINTPIEKAINR
ncbi:MAG: hypothetical protein II249_03970, partial [Bacteroidaceae bacterium]|nr:hypothetical protein [Bacteroidaceae bacterium]